MRLESRNDAEQGGLAATRGAHNGHQFADVRQVFNHKGKVLERELGTIAAPEVLGHILKNHDIRPRRKRNGHENGSASEPAGESEPPGSGEPVRPGVAPLTPAGAIDEK